MSCGTIDNFSIYKFREILYKNKQSYEFLMSIKVPFVVRPNIVNLKRLYINIPEILFF